jgi:hypothetical protein
MGTSVLTFMIIGPADHPIFEVDLTGPKEVSIKAVASWRMGTLVGSSCSWHVKIVIRCMYDADFGKCRG